MQYQYEIYILTCCYIGDEIIGTPNNAIQYNSPSMKLMMFNYCCFKKIKSLI